MNSSDKAFTTCITAIMACVLGAIGFGYVDKRKHEKFMLSLPPEYFMAEAEKARANAELDAKKYEAQKSKEVAEYKAKLEFEKNASPEYWTYKNAQEERATRERIARQDNETRKAQVAELRRAFESYNK